MEKPQALFGGVVFIFFYLMHNSVHAQTQYDIPVSTCEVEMLQAFEAAEGNMTDSFEQFLDLPGVTAVAKSNPENLNFYRTRYECNLHTICETIQNPGKDFKYSFGAKFSNCFSSKTGVETVAEFESHIGVEFNNCREVESVESRRLMWARCEAFAQSQELKYKQYVATSFITQSQKENQSFLAQKLLDMRKRMDVLIDKTRIFSIHFKKVNDDLRCTIATPSGL